MNRPFYSEFAWAYDLLIQEPVHQRLTFVSVVLAEHGVVHGAHILDAGCGTGRYSVALAELGFKVTAIDASPDQVAEGRSRRDRNGADVEFIVGDICTPHPDLTVDAILCRGVLNDLTDDASRQAVFPSFARILRPGGVLILDVREWTATQTRKTSHPVFEKEVDTERGQLKFRSVTELRPETKSLVVSETHRIDSSEGSLEAPFTFTMRCWTQEELDACLTDAGFCSTEYFGDYDSSKALGVGDRIVAVASLGQENEGWPNPHKRAVSKHENP